MNLPSNFNAHYPWSSVFKNAESEIVCQNIMCILKRTGDKWRELSWEEYVEERKKDGNFTERERSYFDDVVKYTYNADAAASFSFVWAECNGESTGI